METMDRNEIIARLARWQTESQARAKNHGAV